MEHGELRQHDDVGINKRLASGRPTSHSLFYGWHVFPSGRKVEQAMPIRHNLQACPGAISEHVLPNQIEYGHGRDGRFPKIKPPRQQRSIVVAV